MTIRLILAVAITAFSSSLFSQQRLSLPEALAQNIVQLSVRGSGGFQGQCLQMAIKNLKSDIVSLEIPAGYIFPSKDSSVQDLMLTATTTMTIDPNSVKRTRLYTMCTQSYNMSPSKGDVFLIGQMAEGPLLSLAQQIADKGYQNSTAQSAVWSIANGDPTRHIYGEDTSMVRDIAQTVSVATGIPMSSFLLQPRRHQITSIKTSLEALIPQHLAQASLQLVDGEGEMIREYFSDRRVEQGFMQWQVGASHTLGDSAELYLRLMEGEELIAGRQVFVSDSVTPLQRLHSEVVMVYEVSENTQASVGIYDAQDQLYFFLDEDRFIPKGTHRSRFIAGKSLPFDQDYVIKIKTGEQTIASEAIDVNAPPPVIHPKRTISGKAVFHLEETVRNAQIAIYDDQGKLKRKLYNVQAMQSGNKTISYQFQHRQGEGAVFYFRLISEGEIVVEREIVD